jgi:hypothetical protein
MMHRVFFMAAGLAAVALLTAAAPAEAGSGATLSMGGGSFGGHAALGGTFGSGGGFAPAGIGIGTSGSGHAGGPFGAAGIGRAGSGLTAGSRGDMGHGGPRLDLGSGTGAITPGAGWSWTGLGLTRGIGTPGGDDLHLGLSSRELGLGNNFGLGSPDNVLNRAAGVRTAPLVPGLGLGALPGHRPALQSVGSMDAKDAGRTADGNDDHAPNKATNAAGIGNDSSRFKKNGRDESRASAIEQQEMLQQEAKIQANLPQQPAPPTPAPTTAPAIQQGAPTLPEDSTVVATSLGSGEVQMIGAYFAENGAPVASVPTSSVNVSVGGTVPENVALFPPPYDLANQLSDTDFEYFVWGNSLVIADGETNVVTGIVPDVLAHQP